LVKIINPFNMNNPLIEINTGTMSGDVFYGTIRINGERIGVSNLTELGQKHKFRYTAKAKAGFPIIVDIECTPEQLPYFPKMIDWNIWKAMNTKFHSCKSFVQNQAA